MRNIPIKLTVDKEESFDWEIDVLDEQDFYMFCVTVTMGLLSNTLETKQWGNPMHMKHPIELNENDDTYRKLETLYLKLRSERDCVENEIKPLLKI